jgi:hypothetical protein
MKIKQIRYYADGDERNYPTGLTSKDLEKTNVLDLYENILHVGIQAAPGTLLFINEGLKNGGATVTIGATGIYELNTKFEKLSIRFGNAELNLMEKRPIFIDIAYEG